MKKFIRELAIILVIAYVFLAIVIAMSAFAGVFQEPIKWERIALCFVAVTIPIVIWCVSKALILADGK